MQEAVLTTGRRIADLGGPVSGGGGGFRAKIDASAVVELAVVVPLFVDHVRIHRVDRVQIAGHVHRTA